MLFLETWWDILVAFLVKIVGIEAPAVASWAKQFSSDEGQVILTDAAQYGPQVFAGTLTMVAASEALWVDLKAKGITDIEALGETVFNALRTQTNAAAQ